MAILPVKPRAVLLKRRGRAGLPRAVAALGLSREPAHRVTSSVPFDSSIACLAGLGKG